MPNVDQFESMFRAASREVFELERINFGTAMVVTDLDQAGARAFGERIRAFLNSVWDGGEPRWRVVAGDEFPTVADLLKLVESEKPDLVCTYRNLHSHAWKWPYSLGTHLDLLTQHTDIPVMVLPHPEAQRSAGHAMENTDTVMAITDHLAGDKRLVNFALRFTAPGGTLWLTHIEDEIAFDRYMEVISKIPAIDTEEARKAIRHQLLKDPAEYISDCAAVLKEKGVNVTIEHVCTFGHHIAEYKRMVEEHAVDLLVLNTKDDFQLAMHGIAYELAVELREIPLLML